MFNYARVVSGLDRKAFKKGKYELQQKPSMLARDTAALRVYTRPICKAGRREVVNGGADSEQ